MCVQSAFRYRLLTGQGQVSLIFSILRGWGRLGKTSCANLNDMATVVGFSFYRQELPPFKGETSGIKYHLTAYNSSCNMCKNRRNGYGRQEMA